jgi:plasmid stabilization system protein ParE
MQKYTLSNQAEQDITEIVKYIRKDDLQSARTMSKAIRRTCVLVGRMPHIGRMANDINSGDLYYFPVEKFYNYLVFYILINKQPFIVRVLHSRRDIPSVMKKWYK